MKLYSYKNQNPAPLPFRIRLDDGSTRTSLMELTDEELLLLGFIGPIDKPIFNENTEKIIWNGNQYEVHQLTEEEIFKKNIEKQQQKLKNIDYSYFWNLLETSNIYKKLRFAASQSLSTNTLCTEIICSFNDAKFGNANIDKIQNYINILFLSFEITEEEFVEFKQFMEQSNLDSQYTLPDEKYLSEHAYNQELNTIISKPIFNSWVKNGDKWEPPVPCPTDGKVYDWSEEKLNWVVLE